MAADPAAVDAILSDPVPLTRPDGSRHEANNPLTGPLNRSADGPISPLPRRGRKPSDPSQLSQTPAAKRARARRAKASGRATEPPKVRQFGPAAFREVSDLPPGPPVAVVLAPDVQQRTVKTVAMLVKVAGMIAATVFNDDAMKVPQTDAEETAALIVDGWPELANDLGGDAKKALALAAVGSLVVERVGIYRRHHPATATAAPAPDLADDPRFVQA